MTSDYPYKKADLPEVRIEKILPKVSEQQLYAHKKCYLGISLENPIFAGPPLQAMLDWATERFEQCLVIVGDDLCRYNERILNGFDWPEAVNAAHKLGDSFVINTKNIFESFSPHKIRLTRWDQHLHSPEYMQARPILDKLFESNSEFRASVERDAFSFVERQKKRHNNFAVSIEEAIGLSCEYLLEETAVFSALSEQGWRVELYPGPELHVLVDVAAGKYPDVPNGLKQRINVELKVG